MIITKKDFCLYLEDKFIESDKSMIEIVLEACEKYTIDADLVEPLINRQIKEKLEQEFIDLNYLKTENFKVVV